MEDCKEIQAGGQVVGRVSPSTSLLIEALIQQLCALFEGDTARRNKLYYGEISIRSIVFSEFFVH